VACCGCGLLRGVRLRVVVEYIEEHLEAGLTWEQLAAVARLSAYHFVWQFKTAAGLRRTSTGRHRAPRPAGGVTPGQFWIPARIAKQTASPAKKRQSDPLTIPHEPGGAEWLHHRMPKTQLTFKSGRTRGYLRAAPNAFLRRRDCHDHAHQQ
jgi:AraC-like DNA-binding protein